MFFGDWTDLNLLYLNSWLPVVLNLLGLDVLPLSKFFDDADRRTSTRRDFDQVHSVLVSNEHSPGVSHHTGLWALNNPNFVGVDLVI